MASPNFDQNVHPEYARWRDRWQMSWDFYRGGLHVLQPGQKRSLSFWESDAYEDDGNSSGLNPAGSRRNRRWRWTPHMANSYLRSHEREGLNRWRDRQDRACHIPIVRPLVDSLVSGVLRTPADRKAAAAPPWSFYFDDVDRTGTSIDAFSRRALTMAVVFGKAFAVTDKPLVESPAPSFEHQLARGERAYSTLYTPLSVTDWSLDDLGRLVWIVFRECQPDGRRPGGRVDDFGKFQYRVWKRHSWELWRPKARSATTDNADDFELVASGPNPLGRVPVRVLSTRRAVDGPTTLESDSLVTDIVDADVAVYNLLSLLHELEYSQTFSQIILPGDDFGPVEMGPWTALTFNAEGGGAPAYISSNPEHPAGLWDRIVGILQAVRHSSHLSRGMAELSKEGRSAAAISFESEDKYVQMSALAEQLDEFENGLYRDVADWSGVSGDVPVVRRPRRFDLRSVSQQIADLVQLATLQLGPRPMSALTKPVVGRLLKEQGVADEDLRKIESEIDKNAQESADLRKKMMQDSEDGVRDDPGDRFRGANQNEGSQKA